MSNLTRDGKSRQVKVAKRAKKLYIAAAAEVLCSVQGVNYLDATYMLKKPKGTIKRINKEQYVRLGTGEVCEFKPTDGKMYESLRRTFNELAKLIRTNFTSGAKNQLFITLTYKENMTDPERAYNDFEVWFKSLRRKLKDHKLDYISVIEPQERGAWHYHVLLKSDKPVLYVDNRLMQDKWGHGRTKTERLNAEDVGAYFVAYFTDLTTEAPDATQQKKTASRRKGARLGLYPKGMRFYRCSRGIRRPVEEIRTHGEIVKEYGKPQRVDTFEVKSGEKTVNVIQKERFKKPAGAAKRSSKRDEKPLDGNAVYRSRHG